MTLELKKETYTTKLDSGRLKSVTFQEATLIKHTLSSVLLLGTSISTYIYFGVHISTLQWDLKCVHTTLQKDARTCARVST